MSHSLTHPSHFLQNSNRRFPAYYFHRMNSTEVHFVRIIDSANTKRKPLALSFFLSQSRNAQKTMTSYTVSRRHNSMYRAHGDQVPGLQLAVSEDSNDSTFTGEANPYDEPSPSARSYKSSMQTTLDVHSCTSEACDACRRPKFPIFVSSTIMSPEKMRCLPAKWWEMDYNERVLNKLLSATIGGAYGENSIAAEADGKESEAPFDEI
jgi:hypothetical protein